MSKREVLVRFEDDNSAYLISDDGLIRKGVNASTIDVLIVKQINGNKVDQAIKIGYKLFECNSENKEECLVKLLNSLFPYCKTCKFA
ncbi:hypothetical protein V6M85_07090 [Sulfolobus tengchongensis]|uniref:DUF2283 domain-containing protein n=1 Tax=Sulfolobus tengchongensis TaxID=207809 RepID=A0AAX4KWL1_9CREN